MAVKSKAPVKPKKLVQGDTVGVVAPAGPVNPKELERGLAIIRGMGFKTVLGEHLADRRGYLAGSDADRAGDVMAMFENPEVKALFCARGGYGVNRILPLLNSRTIRKNPKIVVGSSDITLFLLYLLQQCSLVPFHGPMVAGSFGCRPMKASKTQFRKILTGQNVRLSAPQARELVPGKALGPLTGGCLTLLCRSLKTPYEVQTRGHILLIEDVNEPPYRIDGMLWQLKKAGKFKGVKGVLFGEMIDCHPPKGETGKIDDAILDVLGDEKFPILTNCPIGHGNEMWTLPLGIPATLDTGSRSLDLKKTGVR